MGKLFNSANDVLPEFQKFLLEKKLVPDKKTPFYAYWVSKFLFLFRNVLGKETCDLGSAVRAKRGQKLPVVFSVDEVKSLFAHMTGKSLLIAELLYGSGLRLMELARLRVKDIDFDANTIFVRSGKGDKDRATVLPLAVKERLKEHLKEVQSLLGHKNVETTMVYTHVLRNMSNAPQSPLDVLYGNK